MGISIDLKTTAPARKKPIAIEIESKEEPRSIFDKSGKFCINVFMININVLIMHDCD